MQGKIRKINILAIVAALLLQVATHAGQEAGKTNPRQAQKLKTPPENKIIYGVHLAEGKRIKLLEPLIFQTIKDPSGSTNETISMVVKATLERNRKGCDQILLPLELERSNTVGRAEKYTILMLAGVKGKKTNGISFVYSSFLHKASASEITKKISHNLGVQSPQHIVTHQQKEGANKDGAEFNIRMILSGKEPKAIEEIYKKYGYKAA